MVFTVLPNGTTVMRAKKRSVKELAGSVEPGVQRRVEIDEMRLD